MFLDSIVESTRKRVAAAKIETAPDVMRRRAEKARTKEDAGAVPPFERALRQNGLSFICEVKKASPSKGVIARDFPYTRIAADYEDAGAAAVSVLTEPEFFLGDNRYLAEIAQTVSIPVLRKDFVIDEYQIFEAKTLGAHAILLIVALLDKDTLASYIHIAAELGLSALVEAHSEPETETALAAGAGIIGINNRDLRTFKIDMGVTRRLCSCIPENRIRIAESGVQRPEDLAAIADYGIDALLIGEALMRSSNKAAFLDQLRKSVEAYF
jgi:indole-3-glycerol phosphate synthase